jgi:hypothetical protein
MICAGETIGILYRFCEKNRTQSSPRAQQGAFHGWDETGGLLKPSLNLVHFPTFLLKKSHYLSSEAKLSRLDTFRGLESRTLERWVCSTVPAGQIEGRTQRQLGKLTAGDTEKAPGQEKEAAGNGLGGFNFGGVLRRVYRNATLA